MNKKMIATSFALLVTMAVVLATGKTDVKPECMAPVPGAVDNSQPVISDEVNEQILTEEISAPVPDIAKVVIQQEVNVDDMILGQEWLPEGRVEQAPKSPLFESLARMQEALVSLQQIAAGTEQMVAALESGPDDT